MGVPGLWRILDLASQPLDFEKCSGLRIAIDIYSYLNRLLHSSNDTSNWVFRFARDIYRIMHFNIRIVIVFMGRRPVDKMFSTALGDESTFSAYNRIRSIILRATKESPERPIPEPIPEPKEKTELPQSPSLSSSPRLRRSVVPNISRLDDLESASMKQINSMGTRKITSSTPTVYKSSVSNAFIFYDSQVQQLESEEAAKSSKATTEKESENEAEKKKVEITRPKESVEAEFKSNFLDEASYLFVSDEPSSDTNSNLSQIEGNSNPSEEGLKLSQDSFLPSEENPYFPPIEEHVTASHVRIIQQLCDLLGISYIQAPEEASAECARLEKEGIVDATASDDNNAILFGSQWLIRGLFTRPQSVTMQTLNKIGINRNRMIMLSLMISGDYNADIRKRLFTVGPVRGMEILSLFPDEDIGLLKFKEWWIRIVKGNQKEEKDLDLRNFANRKFIKKLVIPNEFPPMNLIKAFREPVVGDAKPKVVLPNFDLEKVVAFIVNTSCVTEQRIREYTMMFQKRISTFHNQNKSLFFFSANELKYHKAFQMFFERITNYDLKQGGSIAEAKDPGSLLSIEFLEDFSSANLTNDEDDSAAVKKDVVNTEEEEEESEGFSTATESDSVEEA